MAWSPDGRTLASSSFDQTIWLWDAEQGSYRTVLHGHTAGVKGLAYPSDDPHEAALPQSPAALTTYSAVDLFVQRARQVLPRLSLSEATLTTIVRICRHVAGMPLAIELAAAGVRALSLAAIERQIRANLDVLTTTHHDVPIRHRSMRAVFDHSWQLLSEGERALFSHIAVFSGGWTLAAAEQVAGATLLALTTLVNKSLVRQDSAEHAAPNVAAQPRFDMLEPIREYALERLAASAEAVRRRHARYFTALAESAAAQWDTPMINSAIALQRREHDNMRAALAWCLSDKETRDTRHETRWQSLVSGLRSPGLKLGSSSPRRFGGSGGATAIAVRGVSGSNNC